MSRTEDMIFYMDDLQKPNYNQWGNVSFDRLFLDGVNTCIYFAYQLHNKYGMAKTKYAMR